MKLEKQIDMLTTNNNTVDQIPEDIIYKFGNGPIRYYKNGLYYHGIGKNDIYSWNHDNKFNRVITEYKSINHELPHPQWDTHSAKNFCSSCIYDSILSKKRKQLRF